MRLNVTEGLSQDADKQGEERLTEEHGIETLRLFEEAVEFVESIQRRLVPSTGINDTFDLISKRLDILRVSTQVIHSMRHRHCRGVDRSQTKDKHPLGNVVNLLLFPCRSIPHP